MADQLSITHHVCGKTSYNKNDVAKKYCAACHIFMAEGTYTITEPDIKAMPVGLSFWINGIVSASNGIPYIQLANADRQIAQLTMSQARQIANDILLACSRAEADAILIKFFHENDLPDGALGQLMQDFRDFRYELDQDKAERTDET